MMLRRPMNGKASLAPGKAESAVGSARTAAQAGSGRRDGQNDALFSEPGCAAEDEAPESGELLPGAMFFRRRRPPSCIVTVAADDEAADGWVGPHWIIIADMY